MNETHTTAAANRAPATVRTHWAQWVFAVLAALLFSRVMLLHVLPPNGDPTATALRQGLFLATYAVTVALLLTCWKTALQSLWQEKSLLLLGLLIIVAPAWSEVPTQTLGSVPGLLGALFFGIYLALCLGWRARFAVIACALTLAMLASLCMGLLKPELGIMRGEHEGLWRGAFAHKNMLGTYAVLAGATLFVVALSTPARHRLCLLCFWFAAGMLLLAGSKGAMLSWVVLFMLLGAYLARDGRRRFAAHAALSAMLVLGAFTLLTKQQITPSILFAQSMQCAEQAVFKEASNCRILAATRARAPVASGYQTGSGRLALWRDVWTKVQERPLLGYAPEGFWRGTEGPSAYIMERRNWFPGHAHNGFLDVAVDFGLLGLGVLLAGLAAVARRLAIPLMRGNLSEQALCTLALLMALLLVNVSSGRLVASNHLSWTLLAMLLLGLAREPVSASTGASSAKASTRLEQRHE